MSKSSFGNQCSSFGNVLVNVEIGVDQEAV